MTRRILLAALTIATIGGAYLLLTHGPAHLVGAGWGEDHDQEVAA